MSVFFFESTSAPRLHFNFIKSYKNKDGYWGARVLLLSKRSAAKRVRMMCVCVCGCVFACVCVLVGGFWSVSSPTTH